MFTYNQTSMNNRKSAAREKIELKYARLHHRQLKDLHFLEQNYLFVSISIK